MNQHIQELIGYGNGVNLVVTFEWSFQQQNAPYLRDEGIGTMYIQDVQVVTHINSHILQNFPQKLQIDIKQLDILIKSVKIKLQGGNSWLYQSLADLMVNSLQKQINDVFGQVLKDIVVSTLNERLKEALNGCQTFYDQKLFQDNSFTTGLLVFNKYMSIGFHGQIIEKDKINDSEYIKSLNINVTKQIINKYNKDMVVSISGELFNSILKTYWENGAYNTGIQMIQSPKIKIVNNGLLFIMKLQDEEIYSYAEIKVKQIRSICSSVLQQQSNGTQFIIQIQQILYENQYNETFKEFLNENIKLLNTQLEETGFFLSETPFIQFNQEILYSTLDNTVNAYTEFD